MLRKRFILNIQTLKVTMFMWSDYSKIIFIYIFFLLDALRTPNYSSEEMLIKSCKIHACLHKHLCYMYFCRTDFAMKRGHILYAETSLNAVAC